MMSEEPLDLPTGGGSHVLLAASVDDVDTMYADLKAKGVHTLRPPADQPWGLPGSYREPAGVFDQVNLFKGLDGTQNAGRS